MRRRKKKLAVHQPPIPPIEEINQGTVPRQRAGIHDTLHQTVREVHADMAGQATPEVLDELVLRLRTALPGITFNNQSLRDYAQAISEDHQPV
jgi:hypothetical protein